MRCRHSDQKWDGTVFKITTSGVESIIYRFSGGSDASGPDETLTDVNGALYGTTFAGGDPRAGTVFKVTTSGAESVLYRFHSVNPYAGVTNVNNVRYGATFHGGAHGKGTVFSLSL